MEAQNTLASGELADIISLGRITGIVAISEIAGGYEPAPSGTFQVGDVELHQTLLSPLFTRVTDSLFAWSHQTFAEFLAAYYLIERGLAPQNILEFLRSSEDRRIPPQLHEVSAWLASMDDTLFNTLAETDPDILLRSDVASASPQAREALVNGLLLRFDRAELHDFNTQDRFRYDRLDHPKLGEQLLPYILDSQKNVVVRRFAIDIAEENGGVGIEDKGGLISAFSCEVDSAVSKWQREDYERKQSKLAKAENAARKLSQQMEELLLGGSSAKQDVPAERSATH
ncbi:hypothetical protein JQ617_33540 [Bradyrhizobium sp. KB893862 SZCCT0404]|uniref:hypothetical protein n=1 Tax=Bradyrhizobium sp. KB893862 SZCCT0404 TaxID=2807672 RepID=UPI001BABC8A6|nr:hypothetical protein [Bradyrhizobium sp. KB893862 SZCCT0404]MBR1178931.1 hypothetical protein [Bradyrhizobium sp. KB893862 SZCCT0404]